MFVKGSIIFNNGLYPIENNNQAIKTDEKINLIIITTNKGQQIICDENQGIYSNGNIVNAKDLHPRMLLDGIKSISNVNKGVNDFLVDLMGICYIVKCNHGNLLSLVKWMDDIKKDVQELQNIISKDKWKECVNLGDKINVLYLSAGVRNYNYLEMFNNMSADNVKCFFNRMLEVYKDNVYFNSSELKHYMNMLGIINGYNNDIEDNKLIFNDDNKQLIVDNIKYIQNELPLYTVDTDCYVNGIKVAGD